MNCLCIECTKMFLTQTLHKVNKCSFDDCGAAFFVYTWPPCVLLYRLKVRILINKGIHNAFITECLSRQCYVKFTLVFIAVDSMPDKNDRNSEASLIFGIMNRSTACSNWEAYKYPQFLISECDDSEFGRRLKRSSNLIFK